MKTSLKTAGPFSRACKVDDIPAAGLNARLEAAEAERAAIAEALDLLELPFLHMDYRLQHCGRDRFRLEGDLHASVVQRCVVTLEPVASEIEAHVGLQFWPEKDVAALEAKGGDEAITIPFEGPEVIVDGIIDLGQVAYENLAAAIEPYPRKPGASFEWHDRPGAEGLEDAGKPFAELARLIRPKDSR